MSSRGVDQASGVVKLEYGRQSDEPKKSSSLSIGDRDVVVKQISTRPPKTNKLNPQQLSSIAPSLDPNDDINSSSRPRSLRGRASQTKPFTLDMPSKRTLGNKIMRCVFGFVGGLVTGVAGGIAGAIGGSLLSPAGTIGFGAAGLVVGGTTGAINGARLADGISRLFDNAPQDHHLGSAMDSLQGSRGPFSSSEANNLKDVTARDWRNLLSVHSKKAWFGNSKRVGNKDDRQKIRQAVVLFIAKHGKAEAAAYKDRLIAQANSRTPHALQTEINMLKATDIQPKLDAINNINNTEQKAKAFGDLVRANPDMFTRQSGILHNRKLATHAENLGLESALGVVDRMSQNGTVTEQDRQDLNRAMNILGKPDNEAHPDRSATRDVLRRHVGKPFTPEVKHKVAQALFKQFGVDQRPYSLNLYSQPRRILQSTLDPAAFNKDLNDGKLSRAQYGKHAGQQRFEDAQPSQRQSIADIEMAALKTAAKLSLTADTMVNEIAREINEALTDAANRFETPSQQSQRLQQERLQQANQAKEPPKRNLEQLKALRDRYAPGGDDFERIKTKLGLEDNEFNKTELHRGVSNQLMQTFGGHGEKLDSNSSANDRGAEQALLRAIAGHMAIQRMSSNGLVSTSRANELEDQANDWEKNGIP